MTRIRVSGQFLDGAKGPIFVLRRGPPDPGGCVLVVPPFAEEMNKSRRMITLVAESLADRGIATVLPDLYGTGDSGGDFADADWGTWCDDLVRTARWCVECAGSVTGLIAVRLGCALACESRVLAAVPDLRRTVFWQPALDGSRFLTQFLRLRVAASLANDVRESVPRLRAQLAQDGEIEVAGYQLTQSLASQLDDVRSPQQLPHGLGAIDWFELVSGENPRLMPVSAAVIDKSIVAGVNVHPHLLAGEPFWTSTEIVTNSELAGATADALSGLIARTNGEGR